MYTKFLSLFFTILFSGLSASTHPLKMSFSHLSISAEGKVKMETHIFLDDLTDHLKELYKLEKLDFDSKKTNGTKVLEKYLKEHFYFIQNGKKVNLTINSISTSKNDLVLVLHLSTEQLLDTSENILLVNTLLCDGFSRQINSVKYNHKNYKLGLRTPKTQIPLR